MVQESKRKILSRVPLEPASITTPQGDVFFVEVGILVAVAITVARNLTLVKVSGMIPTQWTAGTFWNLKSGMLDDASC